MKKIFNIGLFAAALSLAACGGDSDSSGGSGYNSDPIQFSGMPTCKVVDRVIYVPQFGRGCTFKTPKLNDGQTFSLKCKGSSTRGDLIEAKAREKDDLNSIIQDIRTGKHYYYKCDNTGVVGG